MSYKIATIRVSGVEAVVEDVKPITKGINGAVVEFVYDDPMWAGLIKNVVFEGSDTVGVENAGNVVRFPQQVAMAKGVPVTVGVEGLGADGTVIIPTVKADLGVVRSSAYGSFPPPQEQPLPVWAQIQTSVKSLEERVDDLEESGGNVDLSGYVKSVNGKTPDATGNVEIKIPDSSQNGGGLTSTEKNLILQLFKNTAYTADMSATVSRLETLWSGGTVEPEPEEPDVPDEPEVKVYTVTNNLTNVTNSNSATTASGYYSATLSAEDGYEITVTITMGGVDITADVYTEDGTILITEVTGDIIITATAELATAPVLYQLANTPRTVNADLYEDTGLTFGSDKANGYTKAWTMVAKVKNMTAGNLWCVAGDGALSSYYEYKWNNEVANKVAHLTTKICAAFATTSATQANPDEICIVITKEAMSVKTATLYSLSYATNEIVATELVGTYGNFSFSGYAGNMMVGGATAADFVGTIEEFTIYEGVATEDQIKSYLGVA